MKKFLVATLTILSIFGLSACGGEEETFELIIYSNSLEGNRATIFEQLVADADFDFEVSYVHMGGGDMRDRLIAEKASPIADVVLGGSFIELGALIEEDVLAEFEPEWASDIDDTYVHPDNLYTGFELDTVHFVYRTDLVGGDGQPSAPTSWEELAADPDWVGKYWAWGTGGTTGTVIVSSVLTAYKDSSGTLDISDAGWSFVEDFYANAGVSTDWSAEITSGTLLGGTIWGGGYIGLLNDGLAVDVMVPSAGTPHFAANISLVDSGDDKSMNYAKQFINWWGSQEVQEQWCAVSGKESVFPSVNATLSQNIQDLSAKVSVVQDLDWDWIYAHVDAWREKIALDYLPQ
jgi:iron(III) transport system substrate-binding protein